MKSGSATATHHGPRAELKPAGFFLLRTPLLPFDTWLEWTACGPDIEALRRKLREIIDRPSAAEALSVASRSLWDSLPVWRRDPDSKRGRGAEDAIVRFLARMTARPTPFSLMAGTTLGEVASRTDIRLHAQASYKRHVRLDYPFLLHVSQRAARDPRARAQVRYRPNTSLQELADGYRYLSVMLEKRHRDYRWEWCEHSEELEQALESARGGQTREAIARAIADGDDELGAAAAYVDQLIESGLLVSDLWPAVVGEDAAATLADQLVSLPATAEAGAKLRQGLGEAGELERAPLGVEPSRYEAVESALGSTFGTEPESATVIRVDLTKSAEANAIGPRASVEISRAVEVLHRISRADRAPLAEFRDAFVARYEEQEVPLLVVLDEDIGVGYSPFPGRKAPLLRSLRVPPPPPEISARWDPGQALLLRRIVEALCNGEPELSLSEEDLRTLENPPETRIPLPPAFAVLAQVLAPSAEAVDDGNLRVQVSGFNFSGALFGRYCHLDEKLRDAVVAFLEKEAELSEPAICAEVVHEPMGLTSALAVLSRPSLRRYEIPYLGRSLRPLSDQIPVQDLMLSVRAGRLVLRSRRLGREVIPRLSSAHAYWALGHLPVYQFLCRFQNEMFPHRLADDWGPVINALTRVPRIVAGRTIISRARWTLGPAELERLLSLEGRALDEWRKRHGVPRFVELSEEEAGLLIDFENPLSVRQLEIAVRAGGRAVLEEMLQSPGDILVAGPEGRFRSELVVPLFAPSKPAADASLPAISAVPHGGLESSVEVPSRRVFGPGSEWLYLKLYLGPFLQDRLLLEVLSPTLRKLADESNLDRWFFIRYQDPDWHLRLRLSMASERVPDALERLHQCLEPLLQDGVLKNVQIDTYVRELERYGGAEAIEHVERIFHHDSEAALEILEALDGNEEMRWQTVLYGMHRLLEDFDVALSDRVALLDDQREFFGREFRVDTTLRRMIGQKHREYRRALDGLLAPDRSGLPEAVCAAFDRRSEGIAPEAGTLHTLSTRGRLRRPLPLVVSSLLHMHANRIFRSEHRLQELVLYNLLHRSYAGARARQQET